MVTVQCRIEVCKNVSGNVPLAGVYIQYTKLLAPAKIFNQNIKKLN